MIQKLDTVEALWYTLCLFCLFVGWVIYFKVASILCTEWYLTNVKSGMFVEDKLLIVVISFT